MHRVEEMKRDVKDIRKDFPILSQKAHGKDLVYLDNAATTHKPLQVIEAMRNYNETMHSNAHRGSHYLSVLATEAYEGVREKVKEFIHAKKAKEIIFTRGSTESFNLIAYSYGMHFIEEGDEIVISIAEHHSNLLPWQQVAKAKGAILKYMYLDQDCRLNMEEVEEKITPKTKLVSITHMSNVLGTINPIRQIADYAHSMGAVVVVDGAQSVPHMKVDVQELDADFFVFSAHKMLGPMGVGVLYGKQQFLEKMPPFLFGGSMIEYVTEQDATYAPLPSKFEAGTQNVEGVVGLGAAIDYLKEIGIEAIRCYECGLTAYALEKMRQIPYVTVYGPTSACDKGGVVSFNIEGVHPHDVGSIIDTYGIAIRVGHHCAQPLMRYLDVPATCRVSFYFYNTLEEVDAFIEGIKNIRKWLGYGS